MREAERIRKVYAKRAEEKSGRYDYWQPGTRYLIQQLERDVTDKLSRLGLLPLGRRRVLDAGCGTGSWLRFFLRLGAQPENLHGIDVLPERIQDGTRLSTNLSLVMGDAAHLPYNDNYFDLAMQFTMFTSILEDETRRHVAREMLRVLKPSGLILWYDFILNPGNSDTRGIGAGEIRRLFPACEVRIHRVTLMPPLSRRLARISWLACYLLERIPWLRTHCLAAITKPEANPERELHPI